jgi:hypothetical protein
VVAGIVVAAVLAGRGPAPSSNTGLVADAVKVAIQKLYSTRYRTATSRTSPATLCGLYDGVKDRRTDEALARMSSDAFRNSSPRPM